MGNVAHPYPAAPRPITRRGVLIAIAIAIAIAVATAGAITATNLANGTQDNGRPNGGAPPAASYSTHARVPC